MNRPLAAALLISFSLAACNKAPAPPAAPAAPVAPEAPVAPAVAPEAAKPAAALSVTSVDLGTAVGADGKVSAAQAQFAPTDTIIAAITLANAGTPSVSGNVGVRWLGADGVAFNDESQQKDFATGAQTVNFRVANPKGFAPGAYKLEVSLNGSVAQTRDYSVK